MKPGKEVLVTAAPMLQRWCLFLGVFSYAIDYCNTKEHANCDGLSRLPMSGGAKDRPDESEVYQMSVVESLPVTEKELRTHIRRDPRMDGKAERLTSKLHPMPTEKMSLPCYMGKSCCGERESLFQRSCKEESCRPFTKVRLA